MKEILKPEIKREWIGKGGYTRNEGVVSVNFPYDINEKTVYHPFCVEKNYDDSSSALASVVNYQKAKKSGLKVVSFYELVEEGGAIVRMSNLNVNGWRYFSLNKSKIRDQYKKGRFKIEINTFKKLVKNVLREATKDAKKCIQLNYDCFFIGHNKSENKIDFVIGDYDELYFYDFYEEQILEYNVKAVYNFFMMFIGEYIGRKSSSYENILYKTCNRDKIISNIAFRQLLN